jgi:hypothetical protein
MARIVMDGDVNRVFDQLQHANAKREKDQRELRQAAEVELLEGTTYREYEARRRAQAHLLVEPKLPEDEMTYRDYRVARTHDRRGAPDENPVLLLEQGSWSGLGFEIVDPVVAVLPPGSGADE